MITYDLGELVARFDTRPSAPDGGAVVGRLGAFLGEAVLLDLLADALRASGSSVEHLAGKPTRDDSAFAFDGITSTDKRDLDAWLIVDGVTLVAVECKHLTSSSLRCGTVGDDVAGYALGQWAKLLEYDLHTDDWTDISKIGLPLRRPAGWDGPLSGLRRVLATWTPISQDGQGYWSTTTTTSPVDGTWQHVPVEVFSGSLYARKLIAQGRPRVEATVSGIQVAFDALDAVHDRRTDVPHRTG